jgi:uncharacterized protein (TIGR02453 family)
VTTGSDFQGFHPDATEFLADLAMNNERAWFQARKGEYERLCKAPMEAFVVALAERLAVRDLPLLADPKRSPFRIYRDTRFAKDKTPYKTHLGANFPWLEAGREIDAGAHANGGYFHFEPGRMYVGGGMWMAERARLEAFRQAIVHDEARVRAAIQDPGFVAAFGSIQSHHSLVRVPPGYPADHPLADMFRFKDVIFGRSLDDAEVYSPNLPDLVADAYAAAMPVFRLLATLRG